MEEKAKRIGKFNIVDIIAVILIVAVVAFVGWKLLSRGSVEAGETAMTNVTYTVKVEVCRRSCTRPARPICLLP